MKRITYSYFPNGKRLALTMSYDDGQVFDLRLAEIFDRYGIRGTFHLNSGRLNTPGHLTDADVRALSGRHEISCHSFNHPYMDKLAPEVALREIIDDRAALEELTGGIIRGMSYPYGAYSPELIPLMRGAGMEYSRTVVSTNEFHLPQDFMQWHPTTHHKGDLTGLWDNLKPRDTLQLMYVWGHSFEFDRNDNWHIIEDFCELAANRDDVWYATNIEIVDYVTALRGLRFSANGRSAATRGIP